MKFYKPITDNTESMVTHHLQKISHLHIDYVALGIQNKKIGYSASVMSNKEWQREFVKNNYCEHDPLRLAMLKSPNKILCFDHIDYLNSYGTHIMETRRKFGIVNGLVLIDHFFDHNIVMTLGTGFKNFSPSEIILQNLCFLNTLKNDLINLVLTELPPM